MTPIIAAYDPFLEDRAPVELAQAIGALTGAPVLVVAVVPAVVIDAWVEPYAVDPALLAAIDASLAKLSDENGVETRAVTDVSVPRALHAIARRTGAGLIVVGSTGRSGAGRVLPGSTAERLLQGAECPVALAPKGYRRAPLHNVAVGFTDTPEGHAALSAAHLLAGRAGANLRVIAVLHPSGGLDAALAQGAPPLRGRTLEGRHRFAHEEALRRAVAALPDGVEIETEVHVDDPADVLLRVSEHADALVCGSRGYGPVRSVLLGGVSRRVVDGAQCPVLVLPRDAANPLEGLVSAAAAAA
jgi:nucleotide-binding universal stress UspA family protein